MDDTSKAELRVLGEDIPRVDGMPRVTGEALYTDDLAMPRLLVGKLLRAPHAHALIRGINIKHALAMPGVLAVLTGEDLPSAFGILPVSQDEHALAKDRVRYIGEPVAAVAALTEDIALKALGAIEVDYEPLPAILSLDDALKEEVLIHPDHGSNVLRGAAQRFGDVDAAMDGAPYTLERTYEYGASTHVPLETHSALATWSEGALTLTSSTQVPHYLHRVLAQVLEVEMAAIRVIKPYVGAGYGGKSEAFSCEIVAAALSRKTGRPVRITQTREETFYTHRGRHLMRFWLKTAHREDGSLLACDLKAWLDTGAYASFGVVTTWYAGAFGTLPYVLPTYRFQALSLYTNTPPAGPKRGHGTLQPRFAFEVHLDEVARDLKLCPGKMRREMSVTRGHVTINDLKVTSAGMKEAIDAVMSASGWSERYGKLPPGRGLGMACSVYMSGAGHPIYHNQMPHSAVRVSLDRSGAATLFCGTAEIGQGSSTILAGIVAEGLPIPIEAVRVVEGDTALTPVDLGSYSSRVTYMCGNAALRAVEALGERLRGEAAGALKVALEDVEMRGGGYGARGGEGFISLKDVIARGEASGGPLVATGTYRPPESGGSFGGKGAGPSPAYSFTAQVAEVEVDEDTGEVDVLKVWCAHDCGRALNAQGVVGQVEGSVYMGHGEALFETMTYHQGSGKQPVGYQSTGNQSAGNQGAGLMKNPTILEYRLPTILDAPEIETIVIESLDPGGPFGAKEAGEGPQLPVVPAIHNAIFDATGIRIRRAPITPDKLARLLDGRAESILPPTAPQTDAERRALRRGEIMAKRRARGQRPPEGGGP